MFRIMEVLDFLELHFSHEFVPNTWKTSSGDDSIVVLFGGGTNGKHVGTPILQFLVRATKESVAEQMAYDLFEFFDYKTNFQIGNSQVVISRGQQASPLYTGKDENDRFIYSVNIVLTVSL